MKRRISFWQRIWRIRLRYALLVALPLQIGVALFLSKAHSAYLQYRTYARHLASPNQPDPMPPFVLEQWRFFAREELRKLGARLLAPSPTQESPLETFHLSVSSRRQDALNESLPESGKTDSKKARLTTPEGEYAVKTRYLGDNHWHWLYDQKSWRVRLRNDENWRNREVIGFKNPPAMLTIDEPLVNELARDLGLLAPDVTPVRLLVNNQYAGLYLRWDNVDESLLRRARRMPGSIYSGDFAPADPVDGVSRLFRDGKHWKKDASRNAEREAERDDIDLLIEVLGMREPLVFHHFASRHLDIDKFARFIAIDRAFGSSHHDFHHNHKLYFDPYRGKFEPIEWDLGVWQLEFRPYAFDAALNPLLIALRTVPQFDLQLTRTLYDLLQTELQTDKVTERLMRLDRMTRSARIADGNRDGRNENTKLMELPLTHSTHYSMEEYDAALEAIPGRYRARRDRLLTLIADCRLALQLEATGEPRKLTFYSSGTVAGEWTRLEVRRDTAAAATPIEVIRDQNRNGILDAKDPVIGVGRPSEHDRNTEIFNLTETLYPGLADLPIFGISPLLWGTTDLVPAPLEYRYFLRGAGVDQASVAVTTRNVITAQPVATSSVAAPPPAVDRLRSCHPWQLPGSMQPNTITFGPGEVRIDKTIRCAAATTLRLLPGTTLLMAPDASLLCKGPVFGEGTAQAPIRIRPQYPRLGWGCFSLQGPGTVGSRLVHCDIEGGSAIDVDLLQLTGMLNIADTTDITMTNCRIGPNAVGDDAMHWAYVTRGLISGCQVVDAPFDAVDLDICEDVTVRDCRFRGAGNDGLDLMTSAVTVTGCRFENCGDKGISVGEASYLSLDGNLYNGCQIGIQIKDSSQVRAKRIEMRGCTTGISLLHKNRLYSEEGSIEAQSLHCNEVGEAIAGNKRFRVAIDAIFLDGERWVP